MTLCTDCGLVNGIVGVGPLRVCARCAEAHIRSLEAVAVERAQDWQRERIRAEQSESDVAQMRCGIVEMSRDYQALTDRLDVRIERLRAVARTAREISDAFHMPGGSPASFSYVHTGTKLQAALAALQPGDLSE